MTYEEIMTAWRKLYNEWGSKPKEKNKTLIADLQGIVFMCDKYIAETYDDESDEYGEIFELDTRLSSYIDILKSERKTNDKKMP
jgi:hypothetical protein